MKKTLLSYCLICVLCVLLNAETFWDESCNACKIDTFINKYFFKPLKNLKDAYIQIKVINITMIEDIEEVCKHLELNYNKKNNKCTDDLGKQICDLHPKSKKQMEKYILESIEFPYNTYNVGYMFMNDNACGYAGKVKIFGYIWNFKSRGGSIELTREITKTEKISSIEQSPIEAYRQGLIENQQAKKYLICESRFCSPRAENEND